MDPESATVRPTSICTIGDLVLDVVVLPDRPLAADAHTPATIRFAAGGQAANVAAWAGALGASSRLICKRGTDVSSELAAGYLVGGPELAMQAAGISVGLIGAMPSDR